ncbi:MAG: fused MFS/spermidine synthase [Candidatus Omnitrophica bacterium]|nr:fused MFS/spermidine synthase [Candidatus Omnitrophota bacterium]
MGIIYALFVLGITAVSSQILLLREFFTSFYGNELSIGFALSVWLLGGSVGSGPLARFFSERIKEKRALFSFLQIGLAAFVPLSILAARCLKLAFHVGIGEIPGIGALLAAAVLIFTPIALLVAFLFVLGSQMVVAATPSKKIGYAYTLEAAGAALGGLLTSFFLIKYFTCLPAAFLLSALNLISAAWIVYACKKAFLKNALRSSAILLTGAVITAGLLGGVNYLEKESERLSWKGFNVLDVEDSIYGKVAVTERAGQINFFQNGLFLFSSNDPLTAEETVHFPMVFLDSPEDILLIGGGGEVLAEILKYPGARIDYVELDPLIITLSRKYLKEKPFYSLDDKRVLIKNTDGRFFVKTSKTLYDAIIINLPNPYTAEINRFYTKEFFEEIKSLLKDKGVVGFSVSSSANYLSREQAMFLESLSQTAESVFPDVKIIPGNTAYFLLSKNEGLISLDPEFIAARLAKKGIHTLYVRDYYLFSLLSRERQSYLKNALGRVQNAVRINFDLSPISYFYDTVLWSSYLSFSLSKFFMYFTTPRLLLISVTGIFALFFVFLFLRRGKGFVRHVTLLALGTTGMSEIAFQIIIVLSFQALYGYLYYKIGIIITSFMLGLGAGGMYMTRKLDLIKNPYGAYIKIQWLVVAYPIFLLLCIKAFGGLRSEPFYSIGGNIFAFLPLIAGFIGGLQYPLANRIYLGSRGTEVSRSVSATYSVDLLGSFVGALCVSALLMPILGIPVTCFLLVLLNTATLILLLIGSKQSMSYA